MKEITISLSTIKLQLPHFFHKIPTNAALSVAKVSIHIEKHLTLIMNENHTTIPKSYYPLSNYAISEQHI